MSVNVDISCVRHDINRTQKLGPQTSESLSLGCVGIQCPVARILLGEGWLNNKGDNDIKADQIPSVTTADNCKQNATLAAECVNARRC